MSQGVKLSVQLPHSDRLRVQHIGLDLIKRVRSYIVALDRGHGCLQHLVTLGENECYS